jgi:hypothetical protein
MFVVPPTTWYLGFVRLGVWAIVALFVGVGLPASGARWPIVAIVAAGTGALLAWKPIRRRGAVIAVLITAATLAGGGAHLTYRDHAREVEATRREHEAQAARERRLRDMASNPQPYVREGEKHIRDGNHGWAQQVIDDLRKTNHPHLAASLEKRLAAHRAEEQQQEENQRAAARARGRQILRVRACENVCFAPVDRCQARYGAGSTACADVRVAAVACQQRCARGY